jgi:hypothetical protein
VKFRSRPARDVFLVPLFLLGFWTSSFAQENQPLPEAGGFADAHDSSAPRFTEQEISSYCESSSQKVDQPAALREVCAFALTLDRRLPNVICTEETTRYTDKNFLGVSMQDRVTSKVSYEGGKEYYKDIAINGKAINSDLPDLRAAWSTGEFASVLRAVFLPESEAEFKFKKREVHGSTSILIYDFRITRQHNHAFYMQVGSKKAYPGYSGQLWVSEADSHLVRLIKGDIVVDRTFPIREFKATVDYSDVQLGDGTSFDLPVKSETTGCRSSSQKPCWINVLEFRNWHKFAARTRLLTDAESQPNDVGETTPSSPDAIWAQLGIAGGGTNRDRMAAWMSWQQSVQLAAAPSQANNGPTGPHSQP